MPFDPKAFKDAATQSRGGEPPDGTYEVEFIDSNTYNANTDGRAWLRLWWKVISGPQRDESWSSQQTIDQYDKNGDPNAALSYTTDLLNTMGVDFEAMYSEEDLRIALRRLHGHAYEVDVKRSGQFVNTYVKRELVGYQESLAGVAPAPGKQPGSAVYGDDQPPPMRSGVTRTGQSDVTPDAPPQKGDVDPQTGEPIPF